MHFSNRLFNSLFAVCTIATISSVEAENVSGLRRVLKPMAEAIDRSACNATLLIQMECYPCVYDDCDLHSQLKPPYGRTSHMYRNDFFYHFEEFIDGGLCNGDEYKYYPAPNIAQNIAANIVSDYCEIDIIYNGVHLDVETVTNAANENFEVGYKFKIPARPPTRSIRVPTFRYQESSEPTLLLDDGPTKVKGGLRGRDLQEVEDWPCRYGTIIEMKCRQQWTEDDYMGVYVNATDEPNPGATLVHGEFFLFYTEWVDEGLCVGGDYQFFPDPSVMRSSVYCDASIKYNGVVLDVGTVTIAANEPFVYKFKIPAWRPILSTTSMPYRSPTSRPTSWPTSPPKPRPSPMATTPPTAESSE